MVSFAAALTSTTYLLQPLGDNQLVSLAPQYFFLMSMVSLASVQHQPDLTLFIVENPCSHQALAEGYIDFKWITFMMSE